MEINFENPMLFSEGLLCPIIIMICLLNQLLVTITYFGLSAYILGHVVSKYQQDCAVIMFLFHSVYRLLILV